MYRVEKIISEGLELLPNIVDTPIWKDFDGFNNDKCTKTIRLIGTLYNAIEQRENYYQLNTPTAFGDPQYTLRCGVVIGILQGAELEEVVENEKIVIKRNNRKILIVDKVKRPQAYCDTVRENSETLRALGL